jgi:hypothetical protein
MIPLKLVKTALEGHNEERQVLENIDQYLALCRATWPLLVLPYPAPRASASGFPPPRLPRDSTTPRPPEYIYEVEYITALGACMRCV